MADSTIKRLTYTYLPDIEQKSIGGNTKQIIVDALREGLTPELDDYLDLLIEKRAAGGEDKA